MDRNTFDLLIPGCGDDVSPPAYGTHTPTLLAPAHAFAVLFVGGPEGSYRRLFVAAVGPPAVCAALCVWYDRTCCGVGCDVVDGGAGISVLDAVAAEDRVHARQEDDARVASGAEEGVAIGGDLIRRVVGPAAVPNAMALSPDETLLAASFGSRVFVFDVPAATTTTAAVRARSLHCCCGYLAALQCCSMFSAGWLQDADITVLSLDVGSSGLVTLEWRPDSSMLLAFGLDGVAAVVSCTGDVLVQPVAVPVPNAATGPYLSLLQASNAD